MILGVLEHEVARMTEQATELACYVIVVNAQPPASSVLLGRFLGRTSADVAPSIVSTYVGDYKILVKAVPAGLPPQHVLLVPLGIAFLPRLDQDLVIAYIGADDG